MPRLPYSKRHNAIFEARSSRALSFVLLQSVLAEYLEVDWKTEYFADLLFGDYLNREDKVRDLSNATCYMVVLEPNLGTQEGRPRGEKQSC